MCNNTNTVKFAPNRAKTLGEKDCFLRGICDKIKEQQAQIKTGEHSPRGECCVENLLILGAGGYGRTVAETASFSFDHIAFLDDSQTGEDILGICGQYESFLSRFPYAYPAFGNNELRASWLKRLTLAGFFVPAMVHPRAYVSPSAVLEPGAVVLPMGCVGTRTVVRTGAIINMGAVADHDCDIGAYCHLAPGAVVKAGNVLPPRTKVDSGCVIGRAAEPKQGGPVHV